FTPLRRSDLYSPKALAGRTLFFDWMQLEGGVVAGHGLRCHLLTVPGQAVLSRRRWHLLDIADAVVFVTSSAPKELEEARPMYRLLRQYLERIDRADTPILIQANKQDLPGAAAPPAVAEALGTPGVAAVAANAATGAGVRETVVLAIRAAAERVQRLVLERGLEELTGEVLGGEALMLDMARREESDPKTPLDVVLDQQNTLAAQEPKAGSARICDTATAREPRPEEPPREEPPPEEPLPEEPLPEADADPEPITQRAEAAPESTSEIDESWSIPCGPANEMEAERSVGAVAQRPLAQPADGHSALVAAAITSRRQGTTSLAENATSSRSSVDSNQTLHAASATIPESERPTRPPPSSSQVLAPLPPLPAADVPSGLVWPSANGREILQRIPIADAILHTELVGRSGTADGSGRSDAYIYEAGIWCLKTAARRRFLDADEARDALLQLVRHKILLGELLVQNTVLTVQQGPTGDFWLWTVTPWLTTLRGSMTFAVHRKDGAELERSLVIFGELVVRALILAAKSQVLLDVHPSNFASLRDRCYYLDDDIVRGTRLPAVGFALLRRVEEYAEWPAATRAYVDAVAAALTEHLTQADVERLDLRRALQDAIVRSPVALAARGRFIEALDACRQD
ncbi:MAG: hypothetical protein KC766_12710, partial [Myxococcales bacterium]|nr:hypothetical protein [Myxococcales bacterium]